MITNITHNLDLNTINENAFSNINILDDKDNVHFEYKNVPFHFSVSEITESDKEELVYIISDQRPVSEEDLDFYWTEITDNLTENDFITFACVLPSLWELHTEIIENEDESITFYGFMENEEKVYSLTEPTQEAQKVSLNFNQNAYQIFEGLESVDVEFNACSAYTWASVKSENVFLVDQAKNIRQLLQMKKLTLSTEENYELFFNIEFKCLVLEDRKALFTIGNIQFEYEY